MLMSAQILRRIAADHRGVAFIEFALGLPLLLGATLMGLEVAWMALANQKVNQLAAQAADNAARVVNTIDETNISEIMTAARVNGEKIGFLDHGGVVISSIQLNAAKNGQWIRWQRCAGSASPASSYGKEGKGQNDASLAGIGSGTPKMKAGPGVAIIVAEVRYEYQPLISDGLYGRKILTAETAYVVRQRNDLGITNTTALPTTKMMKCA